MFKEAGVELQVKNQAEFGSALDAVNKSIQGVGSSINGLTGSFSAASGGVSALTIGIGTALGNAISGMASKALALGGEAIKTVGAFERQSQSIEAMYATELMRGTQVEKVSHGIYNLTEKETEKIHDLKNAYDKKNFSLQTAATKVEELRKSTGENTAAYVAAVATYDDTARSLQKIGTSIDDLNAKQGMETTSKSMVSAGDQITDVKDAFLAAKGPAGKIIDDMTRLALLSPFKRDDTIETLKMAKSFGMTLEQSSELTTGLTKFATVTGRSGDQIKRITYAMGEMKSMDKVMMRQVRMMNLAGISVADMGAAYGISTDEMTQKIHKGEVKFDDFSKKMMSFIDVNYSESFDQIANSFVGLNNAVDDIKDLGLAAAFEGPLKAYKPVLEAFVAPFTKGTLLEAIRGFSLSASEGLIGFGQSAAGVMASVVGRFETFASLIGGKGVVAIKAQEDVIKGQEKTVADATLKLKNLADSGISMSTGFTALTKTAHETNAAVEKNVEATVALRDKAKDLNVAQKELQDSGTKMNQRLVALSKAGKSGSDEFKQLSIALEDNNKKFLAGRGELEKNKTEMDKARLTTKELNREMMLNGEAMDVMKKAGGAQSQIYQDTVTKMTALKNAGAESSAEYKKLAEDIEIMDANTEAYITTMDKLSGSEAKVKTMKEQLAEMNAANQTMPWADAWMKANEDIMPVGSNLYRIFDTIFSILGKLKDAFFGTTASLTGEGGIATSLSVADVAAGILATALEFLNTHFDAIKNTVIAVIVVMTALSVANKAMSTVKTGLSAMSNPLSAVIFLAGLFAWAWTENFMGLRDTMQPFIDKVLEFLPLLWGAATEAGGATSGVMDKIKGVATEIIGFGLAVTAALAPYAIQLFTIVWDRLQLIFAIVIAVGTFLWDTLVKLVAQLSETTGVWDTLKLALDAVWGVFIDLNNFLTVVLWDSLDAIMNILYMLQQPFLDIIDIVWHLIVWVLGELVSFWESTLEPMFGFLMEILYIVWDAFMWVVDIVTNLTELALTYLIPIFEVVIAVFKFLWTWVELLITMFVAFVMTIWELILIVIGVIKYFSDLTGASDILAAIIDWVKQGFAELVAYGKGPQFRAFIDSVTSAFQWLSDKIKILIDWLMSIPKALAKVSAFLGMKKNTDPKEDYEMKNGVMVKKSEAVKRDEQIAQDAESEANRFGGAAGGPPNSAGGLGNAWSPAPSAPDDTKPRGIFGGGTFSLAALFGGLGAEGKAVAPPGTGGNKKTTPKSKDEYDTSSAQRESRSDSDASYGGSTGNGGSVTNNTTINTNSAQVDKRVAASLAVNGTLSMREQRKIQLSLGKGSPADRRAAMAPKAIDRIAFSGRVNS